MARQESRTQPLRMIEVAFSWRNIYPFIWTLCIVIGLAVTLVPFIWAAVSSFKPNPAIFGDLTPFSWRAFIPAPFTTEPYEAILLEKGFGRAVVNTIFVAGTTVVAGILINSMAGFAFARFNFRGKTLLFILVVLTFTVPFEAIAIPLFLFIRQLNWYDSFQALIIPGIANGLVIFLYRQFFSGVPDELVDAARVDGASWWTIYMRIFLPMSKHVSIGAGLILFLFQWESFLWPLIATPSPQYRIIQVAIARLATEYRVLWNEQFAASVIAALIPLVFILLFQKQFVSALAGTEIK